MSPRSTFEMFARDAKDDCIRSWPPIRCQIQTLEQYLRIFVNHHQDDWVDLLPLADLAYNNSIHASTGKTLFFALHVRHPIFVPNTAPKSIEIPAADEFVKQMTDIVHELQASIKRSNEAYKSMPPVIVSRTRSRLATAVWLNAKNLRTHRPSKKLDNKRLGPFTITRQCGSTSFELGLPRTMKILPVFHASLLEPHYSDDFPGRIQPRPPPDIIHGEEEYEIESILDSRRRGRQRTLKYLVPWKGYSRADD